MDFSKHLFRCSSLGALMSDSKDGGITPKQLETITELKAKAQVKELTDNQRKELMRLIEKRDNPMGQLGDTCIQKLIEIYLDVRFSVTKEIHSKYLEKGLITEEDSLSLYSEVKKVPYFKNEVRLYNDFITGEPDTYDGQAIQKCDNVIDIKGSWDIFTFFATKAKAVNSVYNYQLNGYSELTEAPRATLAYCLIDTPAHLIEREINNLKYTLGVIDPDAHPEFLNACEKIRRQMIYDYVPKPERIIEYAVPRDRALMIGVYQRLKLCRIWLNEFAYKQSKTPLLYQ